MRGENRRSVWILAVAALAVPAMTGCGAQNQDASASSGGRPTATSAETTAQTETTAQAGATSAAGATAAPTPGATDPGTTPGAGPASVEDPCVGVCQETGRIAVEHPTWGPLTVVSYLGDIKADAAPSEGTGSYALYQDGRPVGYAKASAPTITFGPEPALGDLGTDWNLQNGSNVDKYGNVYLSGNGTVTVLTPVKDGYSSQGTLPGGEHEIAHAHLSIDAAGEPTIVQDEFTDGQKSGEKTLRWNQEQQAFAQ